MKNHRICIATLGLLWTLGSAMAADRPNILWLTSEDNGPQLGCYGDRYSTTPHIDDLAARGLIYLNAWSTAPVCAPARTAIISGMYPPSTGAEHMRSRVRLPEGAQTYPTLLRDAGYYCTNNRKEDYNLADLEDIWDESSGEAHWKNRTANQPFFAVFNFGDSHESRIRRRPHEAVHDPAKVRVRAYHPDAPEVRQDWAQYYDKITVIDSRVGEKLRELEEAGLADDTIVFYYGDHGSGMPRSKRWPFNSGLHVPLVVHIPEKFLDLAPEEYVAGGKTDRLVGFIDLASTVLSLAGVKPSDLMQGHAFMGKYESKPQDYLFGFRGRMDERYDLVRSVRDKRYIYIRNYMPHKIYGQHVSYMFQTPTTQVWKRLYDEGNLHPPKTFFWETKPSEELYDLHYDPDEVINLADSPSHESIMKRFRKVHRKWEEDIRDVGFLPEGEIHARSEGSTPYEMGHSRRKYPFDDVFEAAELASSLKNPKANFKLRKLLKDKDSAVRYWAAMGLLMRGQEAVEISRGDLRKALSDDSPYVRIVAAEALGNYGNQNDLQGALSVLKEAASIDNNGVFSSILALNAIDQLDEKARPLKEAIAAMPENDPPPTGRYGGYTPRLIQKILADLDR